MPAVSIYDYECSEDNVYEVLGQFAVNGTSAPVASTIKGRAIESVTKESGAGEYSVVIRPEYARTFMFAQAEFAYGASNGAYAQAESYDAATRTLTVVLYAGGGTASNYGASAGRLVSIRALFRDSSIANGNWG